MIWRVLLAVVAVLAIGGYWFSTQFPPEPPAPTGYAVRDAAYQHVNQAEFGNGPYFGRTTWSGAHRDARNSDYVPVPSPNAVRRTWTGIEGGNFFMPPVIGANGNVYATSAGGPGESHLHAFTPGGRLLWTAAPMQSMDDLDSAAYFSAPVVDVDDHLYLPDANQLWSFTNEGTVRWVTDLPALGVHGYAFSAFFTHQGHVGLISSDGKVALFDRASGELTVPILDLPGVDGVPSSPMPPGLLDDGLIDPALQQDNWDAIWGFNMEVANTPSVSPETGRIFIVATGRQPDHTVLYGLDVGPEGIEIAFETQLGVSGSGTSPTVSFDGSTVYVVDGEGHLTGVSAIDGSVVWQSSERSVMGVSSSTMPDGKVFTFQFNELICWDGSNGDVLWRHDLNWIADEEITGLPTLFGQPQADVVSGVTTTVDGIWFIIKAGIEIEIPEDQRDMAQPPVAGLPLDTFKQPIKHFLVHYDYDGNFVSRAPFVDDGALVVMGLDGRLYATTLSVTTSIAHYGANPNMPFFMRNTPKPHGSLVAYDPASFLDYFKELVAWHGALLREGRQGPGQAASLAALHLSLEEALAAGELPQGEYDELRALVAEVQSEPEAAARLLAVEALGEALGN
ncbi:MAG: PQQ-binding-like beta-propeller repeat protein [Gammaproteobacteria bacterium]|nr:PQQ-binding-like beta-propeller repeat protein [Gammaproteobacteria bacterium]MYF49097.1 PQQ-binding-like beta-propeller repeat protein [Gammaproteobacteria bacterium]MYH16053.1 PQQ-binding-like beta-propeller repeat protein [Gammaproteobacteria bacterium]MYK80970.1 PQQ-binding-like beta-propeller repeat protein [Gammaproteobacteria bacterium]